PPFKGRFTGAAKGSIDGSTQTLLDIDNRRRILTQQELDRIIALYDENLAYGDHLFGLLLRGLEAQGLDDETAIVVLSDHGEAFGEHGHMLHNSTVFDEMIRVPVIVRQPGRADGVRNDDLMQLRDVGQFIANLFEGKNEDYDEDYDEDNDADKAEGGQGGGASRASAEPSASASEPGARPGRKDHLAFTWAYVEPGLVSVRSLSHKRLLAVEPGEVAARPLKIYDLKSDPAELRPLPVEGSAAAKMLLDRYLELVSETPAPENKGLPEMNSELEERLRALGYVE
ncbi:MAG: sulfatase-like hydrolase/transferase, partial [Deltaproteobacteria bacterium]|nr:sulfatase-like hydrolase/transferase [Deltaproteobacteria bacterium]